MANPEEIIYNSDLGESFAKTIVAWGEGRPDRNVPSPSSLEDCTRGNWFRGRGVPKSDHPADCETYMAQETGRVSEPVFSTLLHVSDLPGLGPLESIVTGRGLSAEQEREIGPEHLKPLHLRGGQFDDVCRLLLGKADNPELILVEYKRKNVFAYLDVFELGLQEGDRGEYTQLQLMLEALNLPRALYIAANLDRAMLTQHCRRGKYPLLPRKGKGGLMVKERWGDQGLRPCGVYVTIVEKSPAHIEYARGRAKMQLNHIENTENPADVPTDNHDPHRNTFPCTWCSHLKDCLKVDRR